MIIDYLIILLLLRLRERLTDPMPEYDAEQALVDESLSPYAGLDADEAQYIRRVK
jgi:hypothetical protein